MRLTKMSGWEELRSCKHGFEVGMEKLVTLKKSLVLAITNSAGGNGRTRVSYLLAGRFAAKGCSVVVVNISEAAPESFKLRWGAHGTVDNYFYSCEGVASLDIPGWGDNGWGIKRYYAAASSMIERLKGEYDVIILNTFHIEPMSVHLAGCADFYAHVHGGQEPSFYGMEHFDSCVSRYAEEAKAVGLDSVHKKYSFNVENSRVILNDWSGVRDWLGVYMMCLPKKCFPVILSKIYVTPKLPLHKYDTLMREVDRLRGAIEEHWSNIDCARSL